MENKKITFEKPSDDFFITLKSRIDNHFKANNLNRYGNLKIIKKAILLLLIYFLVYSLIYFLNFSLTLIVVYLVLGTFMIVLGINFGHDAIHNCISPNQKTNTIFKYIFELVGISHYAWKKRHLLGHHNYPNIRDVDPDTTQTNIVRIYPNGKWYKFHKYQWIYVPLLYLVYTLNWVFIRDFVDFFSSKRNKYIPQEIATKELLVFIFGKSFYLLMFLIFPFYFSKLSMSEVLLCFFIMHAMASIVLTLALVPSHISEEAIFPEPDNNGNMKTSWVYHQIITTNDYATNSRIITYLFGAFNHHIVHHLFPSICHVHYKNLTPIVKATILEYELPYNHQESIGSSYVSHFKLLYNNGKKPYTN